jgi:hypothetical protein
VSDGHATRGTLATRRRSAPDDDNQAASEVGEGRTRAQRFETTTPEPTHADGFPLDYANTPRQ